MYDMFVPGSIAAQILCTCCNYHKYACNIIIKYILSVCRAKSVNATGGSFTVTSTVRIFVSLAIAACSAKILKTEKHASMGPLADFKVHNLEFWPRSVAQNKHIRSRQWCQRRACIDSLSVSSVGSSLEFQSHDT